MIKNMKIRKSLIMGFGVTIAISVIIIIASLILMNVQKNQYNDILDHYENYRTNLLTAGSTITSPPATCGTLCCPARPAAWTPPLQRSPSWSRICSS